MAEINIGQQNKPGRSILDYSLVACFTLIVLMGILVLDAFEYITVPGASKARGKIAALSTGVGGVAALSDEETTEITKSMTKEQLEEAQRQIDEAKAKLEEKTEEVEKIVEKVEEEIKEEEKEEAEAKGETVPEETPEEKKEEEVKKEEVVKAVVEQQLSIDTFCGGCRYGNMAFTCAKRVSWMMSSYGLSEDQAKEAACSKCCLKRGNRRGLRVDDLFNGHLGEEEKMQDVETMVRDMYANWV